MPPERYFELSKRDQKDLLQVGSQKMGRPPNLLEKDIWVVRCLEALWDQTFAEHLVFKGGTSLSKAHGVIDRFSENIDLTYDIRQLVPDLPGEIPPSRSQAKKISKDVKALLPAWIESEVAPCLEASLPECELRQDGDELIVSYQPLAAPSTYVLPAVKLEFGARSTGEPCTSIPITCDLFPYFGEILFPSAEPRVMSAGRTFWEKATAIHVYCRSGRFRGGNRFARHWHDLVQLDKHGLVEQALKNQELAQRVAEHKSMFFREKDEDDKTIDYLEAVQRGLQLVPPEQHLSRLEEDYERMIEEGLLATNAISFDQLIDVVRDIELRCRRSD